MNKSDGSPDDSVQRHAICMSAAHHVAALALLMIADEQDPSLPSLQAQAKQAYQDLVRLLRGAGYLASLPELIEPLRSQQS